MCTHMYMPVHTCTFLCPYAHTHTTYTQPYVHMHIYIVHTYTCIYMYMHTLYITLMKLTKVTRLRKIDGKN